MDKLKSSCVIWFRPYLHPCILQSFSESSSCVEELQVDLLTFIIIFLCIFSEPQESSAVYGGAIGGVVGVLIILESEVLYKSNPSKYF
jgi:hypothetical protein